MFSDLSTSNITRRNLRQKKPVAYTESDSESEETRFLSSSGDGEFPPPQFLSKTGSGKEETTILAVTYREEKEKGKQQDEKEQLAATRQNLNEKLALSNKKEKKQSQLERFRARERAEKVQEQDRKEKVANNLVGLEEPSQFPFLDRKQAEAEEKEREKTQAHLRKDQQKQGESEEKQQTAEEEKAVERQVEEQRTRKLNSDLEEDFMTQLNLLSVTLKDKSKRVLRETQLSTESYVQVIIFHPSSLPCINKFHPIPFNK